MYLTNFISVIFYLTAKNTIENNIIVFISYFIVFITLAIILGYFIKFLFTKLKESYLSINTTYITVIVLVLAISFMFFYIISQTDIAHQIV